MNESQNLNTLSVSEKSGSSNNTVAKIHSVTRLEVRFEVPGIESKRLFANGRMQVRVWVFVEAVDTNGDPVPLSFYPDLILTKLIHFHNGSPLEREVYAGNPLPRWNGSGTENKYTHEMPGGGFQAFSGGRDQPFSSSEPMVFWVSSSAVGQAQIAAEVTLQGKVYRSNNTTNPDGNKIPSSVTLIADQKTTFSPDQFRWDSERVGGERDGDKLYRYNLGLYPASRQFKLVHWEAFKTNGDRVQYPVNFCNTGVINGVPDVKSFVGEFPAATTKRFQVNMPNNQYSVDVHQRSGELSLIQGVSAKYVDSSGIKTGPFPFTVIDEYGNDHKLSIGVDVQKVAFLLQRG